MPATRDAGSYVWGFWWMARQVEHLGNPWFTRYIAAPVGAQLGLHALMPLPGVLMMPATVLFGPSVSYNLLSVVVPGLPSYATYRVARLWLPSQLGAIAAGAFFGLSSMLTWRSWYHLNLAAGALFFPLALEAAVRLTSAAGVAAGGGPGRGARRGGADRSGDGRSGCHLGVRSRWSRGWSGVRGWRSCGRPAGRAVTLLFASPQLTAIAQQVSSGGATTPPGALGASYSGLSVNLDGMFALSPRVTRLRAYGHAGIIDNGPTATGSHVRPDAHAARAGRTVAAWRRNSAWLLALLWLGCAALALDPVLRVGPHLFVPAAVGPDGRRVSAVMPYTWFVRVPGLSGFREASRIMMLGMLPAALLAGAAVDWLRDHAAPAIVVVRRSPAGAGWAGIGRRHLPTALPAVDRAIAADHSDSIVVDVPYGIRGGTLYGGRFDPDAQVLATADGHPRAVGFLSRIPGPTLAATRKHAFFAQLVAVQHGQQITPAQLAAARLDARQLGIGWVLVWRWHGRIRPSIRYLHETGRRSRRKSWRTRTIKELRAKFSWE